MDDSSPSLDNGEQPSHDSRGKFAPGNKLGKGNPLAKRQAELRRTVMEAVTPLMMKAVVQAIYNAAIEGDMIAARLWLDTTIGKSTNATADDEREAPALVEPPLPLPIAS